MKPEENEICQKALELYKKGYRIGTRLCENKGEYTAFQIRLEDETRNAELFKRLRKILPEKLIKQIDASNNQSGCFLLIGNNADLVDGVVCHVLHSYGFTTRLNYTNGTNQSENEIKEWLFNSGRFARYLTNGSAIFLRNLEHAGILRQIAGGVRDYARGTHGVLFVSVENNTELSEDIKSLFNIIFLEPEKKNLPTSTPEGIPEDKNSYLLDNANCLHIGGTQIKLAPSRAGLLKFIARELKDNDFLELQYILTYHYGIETMNKMTLSKDERRPFDKEASKINTQCKKALQKDLIKSLGDKKYTLSINIRLPKNSPKDSP